EKQKNQPKPGLGETIASAIGGVFAQKTAGKAKHLSRGLSRSVENEVMDDEVLYEDVDVEEGCAAPEEDFNNLFGAPAMMASAMAAPMAGAAAGGMMGAGAMPAMKELQEATATDSYEKIEEKDAKSPLTAPTSTFRMTTNTASMGVVLNQIREGRHVDISQVRIEELLNFFTYDYKAPKEEQKEKQNIILLLDVSGSMGSQRVVTQETIATVVSKLKKGDTFSLVTYSDRDETVYSGFEIKGEGDKEDLMGRLLAIVIDGCTYGSAGIETAYKIGAENYKEDGNNQVILITDGDLNFGITKNDGLEKLIEEKKKSNLFLSVIGTGLYNYKDDKLEVLSKHGNGTYCVVNQLSDVEESVNRRYISLTNIIAKDVKAQVEFNPAHVKSYRLLGYENRALSHEDFKNDKVISEPYGSGGQGVALYEIVRGNAAEAEELKYQKPQLTGSEELCTVKVRYKEPLGEKSIEISKVVGQECNGGENAKLARFLYCIGEKLRKSDKLSAEDDAFYNELKQSGKYKELPGNNGDVLKLLVDYIG
ncbi:MAG: von Willebrand factor type A domain-containing protein, partial [Lachnospiraceae bacterium]|nr:von Willebrand factor type A domain-containing protein [Lachnospiraceae bacterium]